MNPEVITSLTGIIQFIQTGQYEKMSEADLRKIFSGSLRYDGNTLIRNQSYLKRIVQAMAGTTDWNAFRGKKTLDIGCGGGDGYHFNPWLAVTLSLLGADSYGLDMVKQLPDFAYYRHIRADITDGGLENMVKSHEETFDLVTCFYVFDYYPSKVLESTTAHQGKRLEEVQHDVSFAAERLLKPGGILFWDTMREQQLLRKDLEFGFIGA